MSKVKVEEALRTALYRRLTNEWQDVDKLLKGLALPQFQLFLVTNASERLVEQRRGGIFGKRERMRLLQGPVSGA